MKSLSSVRAELVIPGRLAHAVDAAELAHAEHASAARSVEDLVPCGCIAHLARTYFTSESWLASEVAPLRALDDAEGAHVSEHVGAHRVIDAHVHLFPDAVFAALWRWFERYGWPIRYELTTPELLAMLFERGVDRVVALHYGHKPGMSRSLNAYVAALAKEERRVVGLGTVLPGEDSAIDVVREAHALGLRGLKLHCHVQSFAPDSQAALEVFEVCEALGMPVLIHAGREPRSPAYPADPRTLCDASRIERVLERFPRLRVAVPHFGADEVDAYLSLAARHENLWLDTTMMLSGFFPGDFFDVLARARPDRVMFGTDLPNLPYAWDRELRKIGEARLGDDRLERLLSKVATDFFAIEDEPTATLPAN